jgi:hypothetical protein
MPIQNYNQSTSYIRIIVIMLVVIAASIITAKYFLEKPISVEEVTTPLNPLEDPVQNEVQDLESFTFNKGNLLLLIFPQKEYEITAKVVSKKRYHDGWGAKIVPYDFTLAWGKLTELGMKKLIKYSQMRRFYFFKYTWNCPLTQDYIGEHSSNNHLIPANENILNVFRKIKKGDIIQLWGYLVNIEGTYKGRDVNWRTSTTRTDTGNGACEVIYVEKVRIKNKIYR